MTCIYLLVTHFSHFFVVKLSLCSVELSRALLSHGALVNCELTMNKIQSKNVYTQGCKLPLHLVPAKACKNGL